MSVGGVTVEGKEVRILLKEAYREASRTKKVISSLALFITVTVISIALVAMIMIILWPYLPLPSSQPWRRIVTTSIGIVPGAIIGVIAMRIYIRIHRKEIILAMVRRGFDLCHRCGYWLKGLGTDTKQCPECGAAREFSQPDVTDNDRNG